MVSYELDIWVEPLSLILCDEGFWLLDMLLTEEKLTIEVAQVDCI